MNTYKRHGYLIGEPINYDGPSALDCIKNFENLIQDMCVEARINIPSEVMKKMHYYISEFVDHFFDSILKCRSGNDVEHYANLCKERRNDLLQVSTSIATNELYKFPDTLFLQISKDEDTIPLSNLHYLPSRLWGFLSYSDEYDEILEYITLKSNPRSYIYLYGLLFEILNLIQFSRMDENIVFSLILLPCSLGQIYEKLNPSRDVMDNYARDLYTILTQPSKEPSKEFIDLFNLVKQDIYKGKAPYIKEFSKSYKIFREEFRKSYTPEDDYITLKSTSSELVIDGKKVHYPSIFASLLEQDPIKGDPSVNNFDSYIGYQSRYPDDSTFSFKNEDGEITIIDVTTMTVKTVEIPNPSKYKPRGIHIGCNAVQDRCNWVHHQLQPFIKRLSTDSMEEHMKGVNFLIEITKPSFRQEYKNNIFVSDFSNATDTLSQEFQCMCLGILFEEPVVEFWRFISKMPKYFFFEEEYHYYAQETGQPQGLLGSFDAFSLAHHVLLLMLMKRLELDFLDSERFYRILGDDSIVSVPVLWRKSHEAYNIHSWLCEESNLIKNDSKTAKSFYTDVQMDEYDESDILDFAKISVFRGKLCTPLPVSLAINYKDSKKEGLSRMTAPLWYNANGVTYSNWIYHIIIQNYSNDWFGLIMALAVISSGQIPYLENFQNKELSKQIGPLFTGLSLFGYGLIEFQSSVLGFFISDQRKKDLITKNLRFSEVWRQLVPTKEVEQFLSVCYDNKFWDLLYRSNDLVDELNIIYELDDISLAKDISAIVNSLGLQETITNIYDRYISFIIHIDSNELLFTDLYDLQYKEVFSQFKSISNIQVRSLRERTTNYSFYLVNEIKWLKDKLGINPKYYRTLSSELNEDIIEVMDYISSFADGMLYDYV